MIAYGGWVVVAALVGFIGNEAVAVLQIRVGKKIGSEAMITDWRHARVDGITSLAVLPVVIGSWVNFPICLKLPYLFHHQMHEMIKRLTFYSPIHTFSTAWYDVR